VEIDSKARRSATGRGGAAPAGRFHGRTLHGSPVSVEISAKGTPGQKLPWTGEAVFDGKTRRSR